MGTSSQNITFDRSGTSDWYGIVVNSSSGSTSQIKYATIKNADYGVFINGASPTISNTKINYCHIGAYLSGGSPKFSVNTITYNDYNGVSCFSAAAPSFGTSPNYGDNVIRRNGDRGIYAAYYCTVFLGQNTTPPSGGRNSIYENYNPNGWQVSILYGSTSMAEKNWWGSDPPNSSIFESPSSIDYNPWWTGSDPHAGRPLTKVLANAGTEILAVEGDNGPGEPAISTEPLWKAFIFFQKAEYDSAIQKSKEIIGKNPSSQEAISALNVLRLAYTESGKPGLQDYLSNLIVQHTGEEFAGVARLNWAWYLVSQGNFTGAVDQLQENSKAFPNSPLERISLFQKGMIFLFDVEDREAAGAAFAELQAKYPDDLLVVEAQRLLGQAGQHISQKPRTASSSADRILVQNFPNPFNPSTEIRFTLPEAARVQVVIYNIAGQTIRKLVDREFAAGQHAISWDGQDESGLAAASGIYFMRFQTGNNVKVSKLTLVR